MEHEFSKAGVNLSVCAYCLQELDVHSRTVDHLFPKSRGGKLSNNNKVVACGECNKLKGNMSIKEFERFLNSLLFLANEEHKKKVGHLKKVRYNVVQIISKLSILTILTMLTSCSVAKPQDTCDAFWSGNPNHKPGE